MYILWGSLLAFLIVGYLVNGRNILSVFVISTFMCLFTVTVFILSKDYFRYYELDNQTIFYILTALLAIGVGEAIANSLTIVSSRQRLPAQKNDTNLQPKPILLKAVPFAAICLFMAIVFVWYYFRLYSFSKTCGNPGNLFLAAKYVREAVLADPELSFEKGMPLTQCVLISELLSYVFAYLFFYNKYSCGIKRRKYFIPIVLYALQTVCSTGRTDIIQLIIVVMLMAFAFIRRDAGWTGKNDSRIIRIGLFAIVLFLVVFRLLGYLTEVSLKYDTWENLSRYIGASVIGTDLFFRGKLPSDNVVFAENLLKNVYAVLRPLGFEIPAYSNFQSTYMLSRGTSNAFFNIKAMIDDFGRLGMYIFEVMAGIAYTALIKRVKRRGLTMTRMIWLGILFSPIAMTAIANTYSSLLMISMLYKMVYIYLLNWIFIKNGLKLCVSDEASLPAQKPLQQAMEKA